jgi:DNA repair protein RadA/Sms
MAEARFVCQSCGAVTFPSGAGAATPAARGTPSSRKPARRPGRPGMARAASGRRSTSFGPGQATCRSRRRRDRHRRVRPRLRRRAGAGSAVLIGGDPGIGKSTLLLQVAAALAGGACAYISGEEAVEQVRLRAAAAGPGRRARSELAAATSVRDIIASLDRRRCAADLVVIDSIQTMWSTALDSAPGTVAQVRASARADPPGQAARLRRAAGRPRHQGRPDRRPRVLEHMVDTVLYFEGERGHQFRILRAVKNRFGPTDEIGVFEMTDAGLARCQPVGPVPRRARGDVSGAAVFAGIEGTRPVLVEIQALVAPSRSARRAAPWSAGIRRGWPWCWRCWRPAAASPSAPATSI